MKEKKGGVNISWSRKRESGEFFHSNFCSVHRRESTTGKKVSPCKMVDVHSRKTSRSIPLGTIHEGRVPIQGHGLGLIPAHAGCFFFDGTLKKIFPGNSISDRPSRQYPAWTCTGCILTYMDWIWTDSCGIISISHAQVFFSFPPFFQSWKIFQSIPLIAVHLGYTLHGHGHGRGLTLACSCVFFHHLVAITGPSTLFVFKSWKIPQSIPFISVHQGRNLHRLDLD